MTGMNLSWYGSIHCHRLFSSKIFWLKYPDSCVNSHSSPPALQNVATMARPVLREKHQFQTIQLLSARIFLSLELLRYLQRNPRACDILEAHRWLVGFCPAHRSHDHRGKSRP